MGAGTGSVSVELALAAHCGRVYAVEGEADACALIRRNRERFGAWNMTPVQGRAPEALAGLPAPDVVFIGGTGGGMAGVVDAALARMLASDGPYLLDVAISRDQNVYPMVAPGRALDEVIGAIDVAVGAVRTDVPEGDEADGSDVEGSDR